MTSHQPRVVHRSHPGRLEVEWADGARTALTAAELRKRCPCALCVDEVSGRPILDPDTVLPTLEHKDVRLVGNYALKVTFADGHDTGLFTWAALRAWAEEA